MAPFLSFLSEPNFRCVRLHGDVLSLFYFLAHFIYGAFDYTANLITLEHFHLHIVKYEKEIL